MASTKIQYEVKVHTYDWDSDHYNQEWRSYLFATLEKAKEFYNLVTSLDYERDYHKNSYYLHWNRNEELADLFGIDHGGVIDSPPKLNKITTIVEEIEP